MRLVFRKDRPGKPGTDCLVQNMDLDDHVIRETIRTHEIRGRGHARPSDHRRLYNAAALALGNVLAVCAAFLSALVLSPVSLMDPQVLLASRFFIPASFVCSVFAGLYPGWGLGTAEELKRQTMALTAGAGITLVCLYFAGTDPAGVGRLTAIALLAGMVTVPVVHQLVKSLLIRAGQYGQAVVIYGAGESGRRIARTLTGYPGNGYRPVGFLDDHPGYWGATIHGIPVLGDKNIVLPEARMAVLAPEDSDSDYHRHLLETTLSYYDDVVVIPNDDSLPASWDGVFRLETIAGLHVTRRSIGRAARVSKRARDLFLAVVTMPLWLPLIGVLALVVFLQIRRTPFAKYVAAGMQGVEFDRYRFDAPETAFGDWLIESGLVDLPELFNVLGGTMSLVGPRPLAPEAEPDFLLENSPDAHTASVRPGVTGFWRISGEQPEETYIRNGSFWLDLVIILRTIRPSAPYSRSSRNE
ncbi:MAG: hypothetical protein HKN17_08165 [Rhodothermales bacterium]|nr:hypothetical protein [Rhodothermales bacterium]